MLEIVQIPVLQDNYVYLVHEFDSGATAVVDPAVAGPVLEELDRRRWRLSHIFNTHHHGDHVGGNLELKARTGCSVVGMARDRERIPGIDREVREGDTVLLGGACAQVLYVPGHTLGHGAYWFSEDEALFCGDALFGLGCGRLFEGGPETMWQSLSRLRALPPQTRIYCAHEYTQANARFALSVEPENSKLQERMRRITAMRALGEPTIPSILAEECDTNPFLRPESAAIRRRLGMENESENWRVFAVLRQAKDHFQG